MTPRWTTRTRASPTSSASTAARTLRLSRRTVGCVLQGKATLSTIKSATSYTGHVWDLAYVHALGGDNLAKEALQRNRAQLRVPCTRSSLLLDLWGLPCPLMQEAEQARALLG